MEKLRKLFFDPVVHKYTDEFGNEYTSMTTCIKHYTEDFKKVDIARACEKIGRNPNHPKYEKYKNKTAKQLMYEWDKTAKDACEKGTLKHNYLEEIIKNSTNYVSALKKYTGTRIYTIQDIIEDHEFGEIDLNYFIESGLPSKYPSIYTIIETLHKQGYRFYAEIAVFDPDRLISGLVDLLAVDHNAKQFFIIDWKTNRATITFKSGYFEKDSKGELTENFIEKNDYFCPPVDSIPDSIGHKYSMQLSGYAALIELYGFKNKGNIICHIQEKKDIIGNPIEIVNTVVAKDLREQAIIMFNDYHYNRQIKTNKKLFL